MPALWWSTRTVEMGHFFHQKTGQPRVPQRGWRGTGTSRTSLVPIQVVKLVPNIDAGGSNKKHVYIYIIYTHILCVYIRIYIYIYTYYVYIYIYIHT